MFKNNFYNGLLSYNLDESYFPRERKADPRSGLTRSNMRVGSIVLVSEKVNYYNGKLTKGKITKILTSKSYHTRGIKVLLDNGKIGRVKQILVY